ncbi:nitroreductase family protein [Ilumatobacter sp.]|uniref:nitroreductase family protein n=1 Tax=Ilumatobacter sp. TaxID=1967498 RepID=UPI003B51F7B1
MSGPSHRLGLSADEVLQTTRAVRRRLDASRLVSREVVEECARIAQQAPAGSNVGRLRLVAVDDAETKTQLAELYRAGYETYRSLDQIYIGNVTHGDDALDAQQQRSADSADTLAERLADMPVLVVAAVHGTPSPDPMSVASTYGSALPALWSFMLAARERGLGTCWTTVHLFEYEAAASLLGIGDGWTQFALTPVAHTIGSDFRPAAKPPVEAILDWNRMTT